MADCTVCATWRSALRLVMPSVLDGEKLPDPVIMALAQECKHGQSSSQLLGKPTTRPYRDTPKEMGECGRPSCRGFNRQANSDYCHDCWLAMCRVANGYYEK